MNDHCIPYPVRRASACSRPSGKTQFGLSLVELMIAMTIGLFLVGIIGTLFLGSRQTYRNQDNLARLQENGRFAIELLGKNIREAGYHSINFNPPSSMYASPGAGDVNDWPYKTTSVLDGGEGTNGAPDSITASAEGAFDCLHATATNPVVNTFSINANAQLICLGSGGATAGVILDGVEDMQILYGENLGATHRYVDINTVSNKAAIETVRLCVLLRTAETGLAPAAGQRYTDCAGNLVTKTDGRIRQAFRATFNVRTSTH